MKPDNHKTNTFEMKDNFSRLGRIISDVKTKLKLDWPIDDILISGIQNNPLYTTWIANHLPSHELNPSLEPLVIQALVDSIKQTSDTSIKEKYNLELAKIINDKSYTSDIYLSTLRAVDIYENLAKDNFTDYGSDFALTLNKLSVLNTSMGNKTEALKVAHRAVEISEKVAKNNFAVYGSDFAISLANLSFQQAHNDKKGQSLDSLRRAVNIHQKKPMKDIYVETALILACLDGYTDIVAKLIDSGADIDVTDNNNSSKLMLASQHGHESVVALLINAGASIDLRDNNGMSALMLANKYGHEAIVTLLINAGACINLANNNGMTALMFASQKGYENVVRLLIDNNGDIDLPDNNGMTALMFASHNGHEAVATYLINCSANIGLTVKDNITALMYAKIKGSNANVLNFLKHYTNDSNAFPDYFYPLFIGNWKILSKNEAENVSKLLMHSQYNFILLKSGLFAIRSINPSFFPEGKLFEFLFYSEVKKYSEYNSHAIQAEDNEINSKIGKYCSITFLFTQNNIHFLSKFRTINPPYNVDYLKINQETVIDYLQFYCSFVGTEIGVFRIFPTIEDIPFLIQDEEGRLTPHLKDPDILLERDGSFSINKCCIFYDSQLSFCKFIVSPRGDIRMHNLEDSSNSNKTFTVYSESLDIIETFEHGLRCFKDLE